MKEELAKKEKKLLPPHEDEFRKVTNVPRNVYDAIEARGAERREKEIVEKMKRSLESLRSISFQDEGCQAGWSKALDSVEANLIAIQPDKPLTSKDVRRRNQKILKKEICFGILVLCGKLLRSEKSIPQRLSMRLCGFVLLDT